MLVPNEKLQISVLELPISTYVAIVQMSNIWLNIKIAMHMH